MHECKTLGIKDKIIFVDRGEELVGQVKSFIKRSNFLKIQSMSFRSADSGELSNIPEAPRVKNEISLILLDCDANYVKRWPELISEIRKVFKE